MATDDKSGFMEAEPANDYPEDDAVWIDRPDEGESVQGILLERTPEAGQFNSPLYKLRRTDDWEDEENREGKTAGPVVLMFANQSIDERLLDYDITTGTEILLEGVDTYPQEIDGEEKDCTEHKLYFD